MNKRGFSIIELLVSIIILGTLVLLSTNRNSGHIEKTEIVLIQQEIKAMEDYMFIVLRNNKEQYENWDYNGKDLAESAKKEKLFGIVGLIDDSELENVKLVEDESLVINHEKMNSGTGGFFHRLSNEDELKLDSRHKIIPEEIKNMAGVHLEGVLYSNRNGRVYYEMGNGAVAISPEYLEETKPNLEETRFVGESDIISYDKISELVGLENSGNKIHHDEELWLKFKFNGNIQYVAKKPIRSHISYNEIKERKLIYGRDSDTIVTIDGNRYRVRLMKTLNDDVEGLGSRIDDKKNYELFHNSEYNQLMLPIHENSINDDWEMSEYIGNNVSIWEHNHGSSPSGLYTNEDLHTDEAFNVGTGSWMQEFGRSENSFLDRGYTGIEMIDEKNANNSGSHRGWRPVLELIDE